MLLGREGQALEVGGAVDVVGGDASLVEDPPVVSREGVELLAHEAPEVCGFDAGDLPGMGAGQTGPGIGLHGEVGAGVSWWW